MYKIYLYDVCFSTLQKHQRAPYEEFTLSQWEQAKREACLISEETGLCAKIKNVDSCEVYYFNNGSLVG